MDGRLQISGFFREGEDVCDVVLVQPIVGWVEIGVHHIGKIVDGTAGVIDEDGLWVQQIGGAKIEDLRKPLPLGGSGGGVIAISGIVPCRRQRRA